MAVYGSPAQDMENNSKLVNLIQEISNLKVEYKIICGDFNVPVIDWKFRKVKTCSEVFCFN